MKIIIKTHYSLGTVSLLLAIALIFITLPPSAYAAQSVSTGSKKLAYIVSDTRIPFWAIMARGIKKAAASSGYHLDVYSANNIKIRGKTY